jgi:Calx-beta domain/IPTL-CTERM motif
MGAHRRALCCRATLLAAGAALLAGAAAAQTPLAAIRCSADVTVLLGGVTLPDEGIAEDDLAGGVTPVGVGALPAGAAVSGYHLRADGDQLLAFDSTVTLPGGVVATPRDVVRFDGSGFSLELSGAAVGIPAGAAIDALSEADGALLLSFDVTVDLDGVVADDEDLVAFDGSAFTLFFDGSATGVPPGLDVDAAHRLSNGHLLLSFDAGGTIAGVSFDDEDVLEFDPVGGGWVLAYDGSAQHAGWPAADLDALAAAEAGPPPPPPPPGSLRFTAADFLAVESDGTAVISVERIDGTAGAVGVSFATADDTAEAGLDYEATAGTLAWADGEGGIKTFSVTLLDDNLVEGDETLLLSLTAPTGGAALGDPSAAVLTLLDDDQAVPNPVEIPTLDDAALALLALLLTVVGWRRAARADLRRRG